VELIYLNLNLKFNIDILFTVNYFLVGDNVPVNSEVFLVTDFVNLNIKSAQFFRCVHRNKMCIYVYIRVNINTCISIYIYTIFLKIQWPQKKEQICQALVLLKPAASTDYCSNYLLHGIVGARNKVSGLSKLPQFHFILWLKKTWAFLPSKLSLHVTHPPGVPDHKQHVNRQFGVTVLLVQ
jgi:hypothetical protein